MLIMIRAKNQNLFDNVFVKTKGLWRLGTRRFGTDVLTPDVLALRLVGSNRIVVQGRVDTNAVFFNFIGVNKLFIFPMVFSIYKGFDAANRGAIALVCLGIRIFFCPSVITWITPVSSPSEGVHCRTTILWCCPEMRRDRIPLLVTYKV